MPNSIPTNNLKLWLDTSGLVNNTVIADSSNNNNAWIINNGTIISGGLNGLSTLRFSGNSSVTPTQAVSSSYFNFLHTSESHVFLVAKIPDKDLSSPSSANYLLFGTYNDGNPGPGYRLYLGSSTKYGGSAMVHISRGSAGTYSTELLALGKAVEDTWCLIHVNTNPSVGAASGRGSITINNSTFANNVFNLSANGNTCEIPFRILSVDNDGGGETTGELAELLMYNGSLSSNTIADIKLALVEKWGLGLEIIYPTPTPTASNTPTPTITPSVTPTPTVSPSAPALSFFTGSDNGLNISNVSDFAVDADSLILYAVSDNQNSAINVINLSDNSISSTIPLIDTTSNGVNAQINTRRSVTRTARFRAKACAINNVTKKMYVASRVDYAAYRSAISVIDLITKQNTATITSNNVDLQYTKKMIMSEKQNKLYVLETYGDDSIQMYDCNNNNLNLQISSGAFKEIYDIEVDDETDILYAVGRENIAYKLYKYSTVNNGTLSSSIIDDIVQSIQIHNQRLIYTTSTKFVILDVNTLSIIYSFNFATQLPRNRNIGPYRITFDSNTGTAYVFPDKSLNNQTKVFVFDTNNATYKGMYNFPGKAGSSGVSKARFNSKLRKNIGVHPTASKLYVLSPDQLISNSSFDNHGNTGTCTSVVNGTSTANKTGNYAQPWVFSSSADLVSMSFCSSTQPYNAFASLGPASGNGYIEQQFTTTSGSIYTVEFNIGNAPGFSPNLPRMTNVVVSGTAGVDYTQTHSVKSIRTGVTYDSLGWQKRSFSFVASSDLSVIRFGSTTSDLSQGGVALDNIYITKSTYQTNFSVTPTPTPQPVDDGLNYIQTNFSPVTNIGLPSIILTQNAYSQGGAISNTRESFSGAVVDSSNKIVFIPHNSSVIGIFDPADITYKDGIAHGAGTQAFFGGVLLNNDKILLCPFKSTNIRLYDQATNTITVGPSVGAQYNYAGCVRVDNDTVVLVPHYSNNVATYRVSTNTVTSGPAHGGPDGAFMGGVLMSNNKVLLVPHAYGQIGIYDPALDTYTGVNQGDGTFIGGVLSANTGQVILIPHGSSYIGIYNTSNNTYTRGPSHSRGSGAFAGGVLLPDGKVLLVPYNSSYFGLYDPVNNLYTNLGTSLTTLGYKFLGGVLLSDGRVVVVPHRHTNITIAEPPVISNVPDNVIKSNYLNKF